MNFITSNAASISTNFHSLIRLSSVFNVLNRSRWSFKQNWAWNMKDFF